MDSLPGVMWHLSDAWARRGAPNVVLVHYDDLSADLAREMRRLAGRLGLTVPDRDLARAGEAATFEHMRASADRLAPDPVGCPQGQLRLLPAGHFRIGRPIAHR